MTDTAARTDRGVTSEVTAWLEENWEPDLTVGEWWDRLGNSGWAAPTWPEEWFGKGLSRATLDAASRVAAGGPVSVAARVAGLCLASPEMQAR